MIIDNYDVISSFLSFDNKDDFYIVELIKRKKDDNPTCKSQKLIDWFEVSSKEQFFGTRQYVFDTCSTENCRAYIRLNKRSRKQVALKCLSEIANRVSNSDYNIKNVYHQVLGRYHADVLKKWLLDFDGDDVSLMDEVCNYFAVNNQKNLKVMPEVVVYGGIKTKNGYHLITNPFNSKSFREKYPTISIHKDNPTLLMYVDNN